MSEAKNDGSAVQFVLTTVGGDKYVSVGFDLNDKVGATIESLVDSIGINSGNFTFRTIDDDVVVVALDRIDHIALVGVPRDWLASVAS